jgi:hypothetical protein
VTTSARGRPGRGRGRGTTASFFRLREAAGLPFLRTTQQSPGTDAVPMRDEEMLVEIEDFLEGFNQPTYRGMRVNGVRVQTWSSRRGMSAL